ncbi:MAG: DUF2852 domain-containing protein [Hyphomicrobium sp.]
MPKMMTAWLAAGGGAMIGATLTYLMTRPVPAPLGGTLQGVVNRARDFAQDTFEKVRGGETMAQPTRAARAGFSAAGSANTAFDEYRAEALRRLDEEEREFRSFLDRLRQAKDRAEFDQFVSERRRASPAPSDATGGTDPGE